MKDLAAAFHDEHPGRGRRADEKQDTRWLTCHEKAFLRASVERRLRSERAAFLRSYLAAARRRREWGDVSRRQVLAYVDELMLQAVA